MANQLPVPFDGYQVDATFRLDYRAWNATMGDIHRRLLPLEEARDLETNLFNRGVSEVLKRVDTAIEPVIASVLSDAEALSVQVANAQQQVALILAGGIPAAAVVEAANRVFVTPAQRAEIAQIRADVTTVLEGAPSNQNTFAEVAAALSTLATETDADISALASNVEATKLSVSAKASFAQARAGTDDAGYMTAAKTAAAIAALAVPAGVAAAFAMNAAPSGWLKCNGAAVSRTTYAALFAAIGTTFGAGDGSTTFALPDLRGEFLRGLDDGRGVDASRVLGASQSEALGSHTHSYSAASGVPGPQPYVGGGANVPIVAVNQNAALTGAAGGSETRPRNVALLYCIKF